MPCHSLVLPGKKSVIRAANQKLRIIYHNIRVADIKGEDEASTFNNKQIHDFEDGLEYYSALREKCHVFITENIEDFYFSRMEVLKPGDFLMRYVY